MRFPTALLTLSISFLSTIIASPVQPAPVVVVRDLNDASPFDVGRSLVSRDVVAGTLCANVALSLTLLLVTYPITASICLCSNAGVLTPQSIADVNAALTASSNSAILSAILTATGDSLATVEGLLQAVGLSELQSKPATCNYPNTQPGFDNPTCPATGCTFTCKSGYKVCGNNCIVNSEPCISGVPSRKRDAFPRKCPSGFSACAIGVLNRRRSNNAWECLNTDSDLESCGGCIFPFPGSDVGEDCTAIVGALDVSCIRGQCQAESCDKGYFLNGTSCVAIEDYQPNAFWTIQNI